MSFFRKEKTKLCVALDVGSRTIKGVVFSGQKAHKRIEVNMSSAYSATRIVAELHNLLSGVIKEFGRVPTSVTAGFGTSLAEYHVESWDVEPIDKMRFSQKDLAACFSNLFNARDRDGQAMIAAPVSIEINGYTVPAGVFRGNGQQHALFALGGGAHDMRFKTLVSYFPSEVASFLADMKRMLGGVPLEFIALASAYQEVLANRLKVRDALLIDIGGTDTMMVMIKEGVLAQTASFPFGVSHIAQGLEKKLKLQHEDALDYLRQYSRGLADKKIRSTVQQHLTPALEIWSRSFCDTLGFLYPLGPLTGETYLCGGGAYLPEMRSYVEQGEWLKPLSYTATPRVTVLEGKSLLAENASEGFLQGPEDAGLASVVWYGMHHEVIV